MTCVWIFGVKSRIGVLYICAMKDLLALFKLVVVIVCIVIALSAFNAMGGVGHILACILLLGWLLTPKKKKE